MKKNDKQKTTRNALDILDRRHPPSADDLDLRAAFGEAIEIAEMIHQLREEAGLTQRELAERVGTSASVICRLEDADYEGHSMSLLRRVAEAVGKRVEVRFVPAA
jgi:ribosome-binding protein aMBF1 (putative translation factor)